MEFNAETLSYMVNVVLIPLAGILVVKVRRYTPTLITTVTEINRLRKQAKTVLNILGSIYTLTSTVDDALEDGQLDPDEAATIIQQVKDLAGSPEVQALLEEFSEE
jgi:hypothetical protein